MPIKFVKGDLFADSSLDALAHGCNCGGAMGKGIAVEFRKRFPRMYAEYKKLCNAGDFKLGDVFIWEEPGFTVFNLGTQRTWRSKAELSAVQEAVKKMIKMAKSKGIQKVGIPRIAAGLGGLGWEEVKPILSKAGESSSVELVVFEKFVPLTRPTGVCRELSPK